MAPGTRLQHSFPLLFKLSRTDKVIPLSSPPPPPPRPGPRHAPPPPVWSDECLFSRKPKLAASGSRPSSHITGCLCDAHGSILRLAPSEPGSPRCQHQVALEPREAHPAREAPVPTGPAGLAPGQAAAPGLRGHGGSDSAGDRRGLLHSKAIAQIFIVCVWLSHGICNLPVTSVYLGRNSREILV